MRTIVKISCTTLSIIGTILLIVGVFFWHYWDGIFVMFFFAGLICMVISVLVIIKSNERKAARGLMIYSLILVIFAICYINHPVKVTSQCPGWVGGYKVTGSLIDDGIDAVLKKTYDYINSNGKWIKTDKTIEDSFESGNDDGVEIFYKENLPFAFPSANLTVVRCSGIFVDMTNQIIICRNNEGDIVAILQPI